MTDVFISYKSEDEKDALRIKEGLESLGVTCWISCFNIGEKDRDSFTKEIANAILNCRRFVLILSRKVERSYFVKDELQMAKNHKIDIFPIQIENFNLSPELELMLSRTTIYKKNEINKAIQKIASSLGKSTYIQPNVPKRPKNKPKYNSISSYIKAMLNVSDHSTLSVRKGALVSFVAINIFLAIILTSYFGIVGNLSSIAIFILSLLTFIRKYKDKNINL